MSDAVSLAARIAITLVIALSSVAAPCESKTAKGRTETEERGGAVVAKRLYDERGALLEESFFGPGGLSEKRDYLRENGRLSRVEAESPDGEVLGVIDYRYDGNGRLVGVAPSGSLGSGVAGMIASGAAPSGTWSSDGASVTVQRLDEKGRPLRIEVISGGKTVTRRIYSYGTSGLVERSEVEDMAADSSVVSDFDAEGRIVRKIESAKGAERSRTEYRYDEEGRLVEEKSRSRGSPQLRSLSYDETGVLVREETRIGGIISSAVEYHGDIRVVERYHEGILFVKTSYVSGRKVEDEFFEDGEATRSKAYP